VRCFRFERQKSESNAFWKALFSTEELHPTFSCILNATHELPAKVAPPLLFFLQGR
jgi:hypothetical protein